MTSDDGGPTWKRRRNDLKQDVRRGPAMEKLNVRMNEMEPFPHKMTYRDKYLPAMEIADQAEATAYFERCVEHCMSHGYDRRKAEQIERGNLGYFAGYYDAETRKRVERLFGCAHPVFGSIAEHGEPSLEEAFEMGMVAGEAARAKGKP